MNMIHYEINLMNMTDAGSEIDNRMYEASREVIDGNTTSSYLDEDALYIHITDMMFNPYPIAFILQAELHDG